MRRLGLTEGQPLRAAIDSGRARTSGVTLARASAVVSRRRAAGTGAPARTVRNLAYAEASRAHRLDLDLPHRTGHAAPLVINIHGGAFLWGDKSKFRFNVAALRDRGFAVAHLNYRLTPEAGYPAAVRDAKAAVRWLRAHADEYGLDPGRFAVWGESVGGYLATLLGVTGDQPTSFDDASLGHPEVSSAVQAVVAWYPPINFSSMDAQAAAHPDHTHPDQVHDVADSPESRWLGAPIQTVPDLARTANPISYLPTAGSVPPFTVAHGWVDRNVPHAQSVELVSALERHGVPVTFRSLPTAGHADPQFARQLTEPTIGFLEMALPHPAVPQA